MYICRHCTRRSSTTLILIPASRHLLKHDDTEDMASDRGDGSGSAVAFTEPMHSSDAAVIGTLESLNAERVLQNKYVE